MKLDEKVDSIFREMVGDRAAALDAGRLPSHVTSAITMALTDGEDEEYEMLRKDEIAFHLTDWSSDAAFLVALHLFPERFTGEEISEGIHMFLAHVPAHVMAAARLSGHAAEDIFREDSSS